MKCHWCSKELEKQPQDHLDPPNLERWECPDVHLLVGMTNGIVSEYTMFWFEEDKGEKNKLISKATPGQTMLFLAKKAEGGSYKGYKKMVDIPQFISLVMEKDQVIYGNVISRLRKLVVFS